MKYWKCIQKSTLLGKSKNRLPFFTYPMILTLIVGALFNTNFSDIENASAIESIPQNNLEGVVTQVIDGDTLDIKTTDGETITIRLVLVDAPETVEEGYEEAKDFVSENCLDKNAVVDPDNRQDLSYGRLVALVYCDDLNINEAILDNDLADTYLSFCNKSEFGDTDWAQSHGCGDVSLNGAKNNENTEGERQDENSGKCDPSYPDKCISSPPPDLNCDDINSKRFRVISPDPHGFDGDNDGIGCES